MSLDYLQEGRAFDGRKFVTACRGLGEIFQARQVGTAVGVVIRHLRKTRGHQNQSLLNLPAWVWNWGYPMWRAVPLSSLHLVESGLAQEIVDESGNVAGIESRLAGSLAATPKSRMSYEIHKETILKKKIQLCR